MKTLTLIVDSYSSDSTVVSHLREKGVQIVESSLRGGQFMITDQCVLWHMTAAEFVRMTADKSIFRRILEFKHTAAEPIILIEGDLFAQAETTSPGALRGALAFVAMHNRVPVLTVGDTNEVAELIYIMTNQAQNGMGLSISEPVPVAAASAEALVPTDGGSNGNGNGNGHGNGNSLLPKDPADLQEYILRALPEVGPTTAKAMLKKYSNLRSVFTASAKDLTQVEGIGPKKARKIADFVDGKFEPKAAT